MRTYLLVSQWYYWKNLQEQVTEYVKICEACTRYKSSTSTKKGLMEVISMDFITNLPVSDGYDAIMNVVGKLSKRPAYIIELARGNLKKAQERQKKKYYDKKRANMKFKEGDLEYKHKTSDYSTDDEYQQEVHSKVDRTVQDHQEKSDNVVQLELPPHMKLHSTINIDKLKPYSGNPDKFRTREITKSTPIIFDEEGERLYIIERLVKKRV
ncbi:hypothetical protein PsorP6_016437 [Peronosclerospora sorghi]|uniref:Uncharacterized protein n=1 Tax=Peronosclerospora sorghi TaxID=230839 RepID=A0ACC0VPZ7_9STRA|nr:hypothetical protein PsorP6_016437 [Peronosclerospora sorghi]